MNVVANAIYYNPVLALQHLQQQGRLQHFFATWFQASDNFLRFPRFLFVLGVLPICIPTPRL